MTIAHRPPARQHDAPLDGYGPAAQRAIASTTTGTARLVLLVIAHFIDADEVLDLETLMRGTGRTQAEVGAILNDLAARGDLKMVDGWWTIA